MKVTYIGSAVLFAVGTAFLAVLPFLVGWQAREADAAAVLGVVIAAVAAMNGVFAAWVTYWREQVRWLVSSRDVTASVARIQDRGGISVALGLAIGPRQVLATRDAVTAARSGRPADAAVDLEFRVEGRAFPRVAHPGKDVAAAHRGHGLVVLDLTEPLPAGAVTMRPGRLHRRDTVRVVYLDPARDTVRVADGTSLANGRVTGVAVPAGAARTGGFVLRAPRPQLLGVLRDSPGSSTSGTVADPDVIGIGPGDAVVEDRAPGRSRATGALAVVLTLVMAAAGWLAWPFPGRPLTVVRFGGWQEYLDGPEVTRLLRDDRIRIEADHVSGGTLLDRAAAGGYDVYTVSNQITESLFLSRLGDRAADYLSGEVVSEPMVVATYEPVLAALAGDPRQLLARPGADGVLRLDTRAFARSLAALGAVRGPGSSRDRTADVLRWKDIPNFPAQWNPDSPVSITPPSPCGAGGGAVFVGMVMRDLRRDVPDRARADADARAALSEAYREQTVQQTREIARAWASPAGTPASPFTFLYENAALEALAQAPDEPRIGRRVLLYLEAPVVVSQRFLARPTDGGRRIAALLGGSSERARELRTVQAGRFGLRFPGKEAIDARLRFIDRHHLAAAITAGGRDADVTGPAPVALPIPTDVKPFIDALCPPAHP